MAKINEMILERESVTSKGRTFYNYYVNCEVKGKKSRARIIPKDNGGYSLLDIIFASAEINNEPVTLSRKQQKQTNSNGTTTVLTSYTAIYSESEDMEAYEVAVKPFRSSDEDWIKIYLASISKKEPYVANGEGIDVEGDPE